MRFFFNFVFISERKDIGGATLFCSFRLRPENHLSNLSPAMNATRSAIKTLLTVR